MAKSARGFVLQDFVPGSIPPSSDAQPMPKQPFGAPIPESGGDMGGGMLGDQGKKNLQSYAGATMLGGVGALAPQTGTGQKVISAVQKYAPQVKLFEGARDLLQGGAIPGIGEKEKVSDSSAESVDWLKQMSAVSDPWSSGMAQAKLDWMRAMGLM